MIKKKKLNKFVNTFVHEQVWFSYLNVNGTLGKEVLFWQQIYMIN